MFNDPLDVYTKTVGMTYTKTLYDSNIFYSYGATPCAKVTWSPGIEWYVYELSIEFYLQKKGRHWNGS